MTQNYKQLSLVERCQIEVLVKAVITQKMIAANIGVGHYTVRRELSKNIAQRGRTAVEYLASNYHRKTEQRHHTKHIIVKFSTMSKTKLSVGFLKKSGAIRSSVLRDTKPVSAR